MEMNRKEALETSDTSYKVCSEREIRCFLQENSPEEMMLKTVGWCTFMVGKTRYFIELTKEKSKKEN